ncbi:MAG: GWxTD domain-containing protein [Acidobacteria bacterium]|nr:GWxTD domain-containing protein [Acidobacteriota bacterium]
MKHASKFQQFLGSGLALLLVFGTLPVSADKKKDKDREKSLRQETSDQFLRKWLEQDVGYIITDEEKAAFKRLTTDDERYQFIEQFWLRRDPSPDTIENETRDEHYRRIAYANERFASGKPGWKTDRGRIYITWGPPDQIESHPSGGSYLRPYEEGGGTTSTFPFETWRYRYLEGHDLGNEVIIEFVDPTMSGEYRITMDPSEKDALLYTPNAGLTDMEAMGMASKADRFNNSNGAQTGGSMGGHGLRNNQFERLRQYVALQRPPQIKFKDLETVVNTKLSYNLMPFDYRTDFIKITEDTVLTPITIQLQNKDMTFQNKNGVQRASVNIYGRISTITGRVAQVFEDVVIQDVPESLFKQALERRSLYQKALPLRSGLYKLELIVKDLNSGNMGTIYKGFSVPKFEEDKLSTSSIILADNIEKLSLKQVAAGQFIIGGSKVHPNVNVSFSRDKMMGIYFQIYNLAIDEKTHKPSATIEYVLRKGEKEVSRFMEEQEKLTGASQQMTLEKLYPLKDLEPGRYNLVVNVTDNLTKRTISPVAKFEVR